MENTNLLTRLRNFFSTSSYSRTLSILLLAILFVAVPLTVYIGQQEQDIRQRASEGGQGGCCSNGPGQGTCRSWERCDIANGSCSTGFSCRSTQGCARDSDCGPGNRCQGGSCQAGSPTGQCQSASTLQPRFWPAGADPSTNRPVTTGTPVDFAVFRNDTGQYAGQKVNNEYTPTDVTARITGPSTPTIDLSKTNTFTPTQPGTYTLTATCGNNVTATATLTVTASTITPSPRETSANRLDHCAAPDRKRYISNSRPSNVTCTDWDRKTATDPTNLCQTVDKLNAYYYASCSGTLNLGATISSQIPSSVRDDEDLTFNFTVSGDTNYVNLWVGGPSDAKDTWGTDVVQVETLDPTRTYSITWPKNHPAHINGARKVGILPYYSFRKAGSGEFENIGGTTVSRDITIGGGAEETKCMSSDTLGGVCGSASGVGGPPYVLSDDEKMHRWCANHSGNPAHNKCWVSRPSSSPTPTTAAGATLLSLSLKLGAIGGSGENADPKTKTKDFTVCIYALNADPTNDAEKCSKAALAKTGSLTYSNGRYSSAIFNIGDTLATGRYQVFVKSGKYLRKRIPETPIITAGTTSQMPQTTLITGAINGDNRVDIQDYNALLACWDKTATGTCASADLNDDGKVQEIDYKLLIESLSAKDGD